jgi:hypothetical protein
VRECEAFRDCVETVLHDLRGSGCAGGKALCDSLRHLNESGCALSDRSGVT